jgi:hypothetical protein
VDDWEILELNAEYLEQQLLNQTCVLCQGQSLPFWVNDHTFCTVVVTECEPSVCFRFPLSAFRFPLSAFRFRRRHHHHQPFSPPLPFSPPMQQPLHVVCRQPVVRLERDSEIYVQPKMRANKNRQQVIGPQQDCDATVAKAGRLHVRKYTVLFWS